MSMEGDRVERDEVVEWHFGALTTTITATDEALFIAAPWEEPRRCPLAAASMLSPGFWRGLGGSDAAQRFGDVSSWPIHSGLRVSFWATAPQYC
jgi:hypothetical protein